jgi:hypothetical protein
VIAQTRELIALARKLGASKELLSDMEADLDHTHNSIYHLYNDTIPYYRKLIQNKTLLEKLDPAVIGETEKESKARIQLEKERQDSFEKRFGVTRIDSDEV